jgi:hypothetical protein
MTAHEAAAMQAVITTVTVAQQAWRTGHRDLTWPMLQAWPQWAIFDEELALPKSDLLMRRLGALWHAEALRRCIDGRCLQAAAELLGEPVFNKVLNDTTFLPGAASLPNLPEMGPDMATTWACCGRAIALASVEAPRLRAAVASSLPSAAALVLTITCAQAQTLVAQVQAWQT